LAAARPEERGLLLYHQGLLLWAMGQPREAGPSFTEGAGASTGMVRYLNVVAQRTLGSATF